MVFPIAGGNESKGYEISNSLRLNDGDSPKLEFTPSSTGNRRTFTFSFWFKRGVLGTSQYFFYTDNNGSGSTDFLIFINSSDKFSIGFLDSSQKYLTTNRVFRDVSAWYHAVVAVDTTQSTASNRIKIYINGVEETSFGTDNRSDLGQNTELDFSRQAVHRISGYSSTAYLDGYLTEYHVVDGTAKAQTDFGEFDDNGVWIPKKYTGTYGTNGFFLEFKQTGTSQNSSGIGADTSGNDNHYAVTNFAATDITEDTCTNNFATFNPLTATGGTYSEGNTVITTGSDASRNERGTFGLDSGKWYWEYKLAGSNINNIYLGIGTTDTSVGAEQTGTYTYYSSDSTGRIYTGGSIVATPTAFAVNDIVSIGYNADDNQVLFYLNGSLVHTTSSVTDTTYNPFARIYYTTNQVQANFGNPSFAISSGNTDGKYGNFEYAPPSGYYALCTKRLAEFG
jgi:hypothetical protein